MAVRPAEAASRPYPLAMPPATKAKARAQGLRFAAQVALAGTVGKLGDGSSSVGKVPRPARRARSRLQPPRFRLQARGAQPRAHHLRRERRRTETAHRSRRRWRWRWPPCPAPTRIRPRPAKCLARPRHVDDLDHRHLAETQDRIAAPFAGWRRHCLPGSNVDFFLQGAAGGLQHVAMHLVLDAGRVDHQARVMAHHHAAAHALRPCFLLHVHVGHPRGPGRAISQATCCGCSGHRQSPGPAASRRPADLLLRRGVRRIQPAFGRRWRCTSSAARAVVEVTAAGTATGSTPAAVANSSM